MKRRFMLILLALITAAALASVLLSRFVVQHSVERLIMERARDRLSIIVWGFGATATDVDVYSYIDFDHEALVVRKASLPVFQYGTARLELDSPGVRKLSSRAGSYEFTLYLDFEAATAAYLELVRAAIVVTTAVFAGLFVLSGWAFLNMTADPIARLAAVMVTITSRNLRARVPVPKRRDELRQLITTFNSMLDELEAGNERQAQFVEDMTHDIVTPVQILEGFRQLIERHGRDPAFIDEFLEVSKVELGRLKQMTSLLKAMQAAEKRRSVERADASAITERIANYYRELFPDLRFECAVEKGVGLGVDPLDLERIENILIDNAVKYGRDGGRVEIRLTGRRFSVKDYGVGIAPEDTAAVFERHRRGPQAELRGEGSGIGLAILKKFSEEYGFRIDLESRPGQGSTFSLIFPEPAP